jgi:hypothetical protein
MQLSIMSKKLNNANQYARSNKTTKRVALIEEQIKLFLFSYFNFIVKLITLFLFSFKFNFLLYPIKCVGITHVVLVSVV